VRRHILAAIIILVLALIESAVLPFALIGLPRPNLVLIAAGAWAALRTDEGFVWALGGGLLLDLFSSLPFGTHTAGLVAGSLIALGLDRIPLPAAFLRVTNWVAIKTLVFHSVSLAILAVAGRPFDVGLSVSTVLLPLMVINPILSLGAFALLSPLQRALNEQERFAR
jgi:rod shape-determining protein MreD